jgi:hypothetical protein
MTAPQELEPTQVLAPSGPAEPGRVAAWLSMPGGPDQDVVDTTAAVNAVVKRWKPTPEAGLPWPDDTVRGAVMLAGRMYRRRNSPGGVEVYGSDGATYVARTDPDVAMLLQIGPYAEPVVG